MVVTMTARLTGTRLPFLSTQKKTPLEEESQAALVQIHLRWREESPLEGTFIESFWTTMSLTPIPRFYSPRCILYLIGFTGVYMCEEESPIYKTCFGLRLHWTITDCTLGSARLNWESAHHISWPRDLKVDCSPSRRVWGLRRIWLHKSESQACIL